MISWVCHCVYNFTPAISQLLHDPQATAYLLLSCCEPVLWVEMYVTHSVKLVVFWIFTPYAWFGFKISRSWNGWLWPCTKFLTSLCSTISKVLPQNRIPTPGYISPSVKMLNRESPVPEVETERQPHDGVSTQPPVTAATLGRWPRRCQEPLWCKLHSYKHHNNIIIYILLQATVLVYNV